MYGGLKMSKENRKREYDRCLAEGVNMDGSGLVEEFGAPSEKEDQPEKVDAPKVKSKKK